LALKNFMRLSLMKAAHAFVSSAAYRKSGHCPEGSNISMKLLLAGVLAFSGAAFAANLGPATYHEGTLVSFPSQASGSNCPRSVEQMCSDDYRAQYMVRSEGILYALTPAGTESASFTDRAMLVWSRFLLRNDSLYRQQPGTPLLVRDDGRHLFVRVGHRESKYIAIEAR
jgi:hypothetical protein